MPASLEAGRDFLAPLDDRSEEGGLGERLEEAQTPERSVRAVAQLARHEQDSRRPSHDRSDLRSRPDSRATLATRCELTDDARLLERARAFDTLALGEIHDRFYQPLYRFVSFRVADRDLVEDFVSEVFTRLLAALKSHRGPDRNLGGWLFQVASHVINDHRRKQHRHPEVGLDELPRSASEPLDEHAERTEVRQRLTAAVDDLTDDQATVLALRYASDLPIREVARVMSKSEGAIKQLQSRAIARLSRQMKGETGQ